MKQAYCIALLLTALASSGNTRAEAPPADSILIHGKVYTVNPRQPWAEAIAVRDGKIIAVGDDKQIEALRGPSTKVIDAGGRVVLPGIGDNHVHFGLDPFEERVFSMEARTVAEAQKKIKDYAGAHPKEKAILIWGSLLDDALTLTKKDLDAVVSDRPVVFNDGHVVWTNSKGLAAVGITPSTPDPRGGTILHDPKTGDTTGVLLDSAGAETFLSVAGDPGEKVRENAYIKRFNQFSSLGVTRAVSLGSDEEFLDVLDKLRRQGKLTLRMTVATVLRPPAIVPEDIIEVEGRRSKYHDDWINAGAIKFFQDGLVESEAGAMVDPYLDKPTVRGESLWPPENLKTAVVELNRRGFLIAIHATGDRAAREALDAYELAVKTNGPNDAPMRIEHVEHVADADFARFAKLGVSANMQPTFANETYWKAGQVRLGTDRMRVAYPWTTLLNSGAVVSLGSDTPSFTPDPWTAMQIVVTTDLEPEQRMTVAQAIAAYTIGSARAAGVGAKEGSIEVGKSADLIVVSQNPFEVDPHAIGRTKVLTTMVDGKVVYTAVAITTYTVDGTDIGTLLDDPAAKAVLDQYMPGLSSHEKIDAARSMTLKAVQAYAPTVVTDKALSDTKAALAQIKPSGF